MKRCGFTLVELIVSLVIVSGLAAATTVTLVRQQRFYARAAEVLEIKSQLRDAADVLAPEIRGAAIVRYGVPLMSDSAIELFTTVGSSIVCTASAPQTLGLPPSVLVNGNTLTSFLAAPDTGDLAEIYTSTSASPDSGVWEVRRISSFVNRSISSACPPAAGFTTASDVTNGATAYQLVVAGPAITNVRRGAPIRFLRRARYSIYRSSDNLWYLGYRRCALTPPNACGSIQPVSGPYRAYASSSGESGLSFRYYDATGAELARGATGTTLARIDVIVRGQSSRKMGLPGDFSGVFRDSAFVVVSPRNRLR